MSNELNKIMSKCDELESKDYNNGMTAYELMEENGLVNTVKAVKEVIAEFKARIQLDDDEMAGFLQLEEECGGDLRNYIAELKAEIKRKEAVGQRWFEQCMEARTENIGLKRELWIARAQRANEHYHRYHGKFLCPLEDIPEYVKWKQVERKCRAKAEEYK